MALIKCSECGKEISDKAEICPACGNPIKGREQEKQKVVVIEQTGKAWKAMQLLFGLLFWVGIFMFFGNGNDQSMRGIGNLFIGYGLIGWIIGNVGAWWNHR